MCVACDNQLKSAIVRAVCSRWIDEAKEKIERRYVELLEPCSSCASASRLHAVLKPAAKAPEA